MVASMHASPCSRRGRISSRGSPRRWTPRGVKRQRDETDQHLGTSPGLLEPNEGGHTDATAIPAVPAAPALGRGTVQPTGRRRALLIGINYSGTSSELRGCIHDVDNMKQLLTESFGWEPGCMKVLTDDNLLAMPTRANIEEAMRWLVDGVQRGDVLFLHYSGHGGQQEDPKGFEEDGMNETILPVDFMTAGTVIDDFLCDVIVKSLPEGVRLTAVMDCCHSGTGLDLPYTWTDGEWQEETNPFHTLGDVQMFSGCADDALAAELRPSSGAAGGAMTTAFCDLLRSNPCRTYSELISKLNERMHERPSITQYAQLTSSQRFDIDRRFLLDDIMPNGNSVVGRIFRRWFGPRPKPNKAKCVRKKTKRGQQDKGGQVRQGKLFLRGPLAGMLGIGAGVMGGIALGGALGGLSRGFFA